MMVLDISHAMLAYLIFKNFWGLVNFRGHELENWSTFLEHNHTAKKLKTEYDQM